MTEFVEFLKFLHCYLEHFYLVMEIMSLRGFRQKILDIN